MAGFNCPYCGCHSYVYITEPGREDGDKKCLGCAAIYRKGRWNAPVICYGDDGEYNPCGEARKRGDIYYCWYRGIINGYGNKRCGGSIPPDEDVQLQIEGW